MRTLVTSYRPGAAARRRRAARVAALAAVLSLALAPAAAAASVTRAPVRTIETTRGAVGYRSVGHGSPLVMIMGLSGTMAGWQPSFVDRLARHHRVVVFDNEGVGRSSIAAGTLTIARMGDDTAALITALHLRHPDVLGWSMGGMTAQALVREHPALVRRLVLCATAPGDGRATGPSPVAAEAVSGSSANPAAALALLFPSSHPAALHAYVAGLTAYGDPLVAPAAVTGRQLGAIATWLAGKDRAGGSLRRLRTRVLVGHGRLDRLLPVANARHLAATLPHATLRVYPDAAHGFLFQEQASFAPAVERFLR